MRMLTIGEVARRLGLAVDTVRRMADEGVIESERTCGGHRRFREDVVEAYERKTRPAARRARHMRVQAPRQGTPTRVARGAARLSFDDDFPAEQPDDTDTPPVEETAVSKPDLSRLRRQVEMATKIVQAMQIPFEARTMKHADKPEAEATRLDRYKTYGMSCILHGTPGSERSKVIAELDKAVTGEAFPTWVPESEAMEIVRGLVDDILKPGRDRARRDAQAADEARKRERLIEHGLSHARMRTSRGSDEQAAEEALEEVEEALREDVQSSWSERRVCELADEILEEWDED